ncbi:hypothetical protein D3C76_1752480 [compost metagenome]
MCFDPVTEYKSDDYGRNHRKEDMSQIEAAGVRSAPSGEAEHINEFVPVQYNNSKYSSELNNHLKRFD